MKKTIIAQKIQATRGKLFSVMFEKKDGSIRKMTCRTGVSKGVTGAGRKFDPASKGLVGVYELIRDSKGVMREGQYRMFAIDRIISAKVGGEELVATVS